MDQAAIPPTLPFRLAAAYAPSAPVGRAPLDARPPVGAPRVLDRIDTVELSSARRAGEAPGARGLVAASVAVPVDFDAPAPARSGAPAALPMYRHPADRNAAATAVNAGSRLDATG